MSKSKSVTLLEIYLKEAIKLKRYNMLLQGFTGRPIIDYPYMVSRTKANEICRCGRRLMKGQKCVLKFIFDKEVQIKPAFNLNPPIPSPTPAALPNEVADIEFFCLKCGSKIIDERIYEIHNVLSFAQKDRGNITDGEITMESI